uniref:DNA-formamidopyrimidine glycosylase family protein n=1 Tax=Methylobacterium sp. B34 TaxID=95563 RepID=UPI002739397C
ARLEGRTVTSLARRAKYLTAALDSGETLVMHLGMSGRFDVALPDGDLHGGADRRGRAGRPAPAPALAARDRASAAG